MTSPNTVADGVTQNGYRFGVAKKFGKYGPNRIAEFRDMLNLTQEQLAGMVASHRQQIWKLENGERKLTQEWMIRLAKALGHQIQWWELAGSGPALTNNERRLLAGYRAAPEETREIMLMIAESQLTAKDIAGATHDSSNETEQPDETGLPRAKRRSTYTPRAKYRAG